MREKNFDLMKDITKSAAMTESTVNKSTTGRPKVVEKQSKKLTVNFTNKEWELIEAQSTSRRMSKSQFVKSFLSENGII